MLMTTTCIPNQIVSQRYIGFLELVSLSCVFVFCLMDWLRSLIGRWMDGTYAADRKRKAESIADDATKFCEAIQAMWESSSLPLEQKLEIAIFCISIPLNKHMRNESPISFQKSVSRRVQPYSCLQLERHSTACSRKNLHSPESRPDPFSLSFWFWYFGMLSLFLRKFQVQAYIHHRVVWFSWLIRQVRLWFSGWYILVPNPLIPLIYSWGCSSALGCQPDTWNPSIRSLELCNTWFLQWFVQFQGDVRMKLQ